MLSRASSAIESASVAPGDPASPTLELLRNELGRDANLLDNIPVDSVRIANDASLPQCCPRKMFVGDIKDGSRWCHAWAFISRDLRKEQDGVPQMMIYAESQSGHLNRYSNEHMDDPNNSRWSGILKDAALNRVRRAVLIKVCTPTCPTLLSANED